MAKWFLSRATMRSNIQSQSSVWVLDVRGLTEGSCVCGLSEIFWHFPVDIESVEREGPRKREKREKGESEVARKKKYIEERAHSVPIRPCDITERWWNVSSGRPQL